METESCRAIVTVVVVDGQYEFELQSDASKLRDLVGEMNIGFT